MYLVVAALADCDQVVLRQRQVWSLPHWPDMVHCTCWLRFPLRLADLTLMMLIVQNFLPHRVPCRGVVKGCDAAGPNQSVDPFDKIRGGGVPGAHAGDPPGRIMRDAVSWATPPMSWRISTSPAFLTRPDASALRIRYAACPITLAGYRIPGTGKGHILGYAFPEKGEEYEQENACVVPLRFSSML